MVQKLELSEGKSTEQASIMQMIFLHVNMLDAEYLEQAFNEMKDHFSTRESGAVLFANPFTFGAEQDVFALKLKQFRLLLDLRKNLDAIGEARGSLNSASESAEQIKAMFGI